MEIWKERTHQEGTDSPGEGAKAVENLNHQWKDKGKGTARDPSRTNILSGMLIGETVGGTPSEMGMAGLACDCGPFKIPLPPRGALIKGF